MKTTLAALALATTLAVPAAAEHPRPSTTIVEAAASNDDFETLVAAVKAADLVGTLSSDGPFTVFAPTDRAFSKLPAGTLDSLLQPSQKGALTDILTYHVVAGNVRAADIARLAKRSNGTVALETVQGDLLRFMVTDHGILVKDNSGNTFNITAADLRQSNGVIHVIDGVLLP
ncbi:fasciclin domain-containing protein [Sphingomicrobium sp. B8]|uniref:Fasciclin domain-containing protein n=2 Tax=Sphingomicrobium clamense TaxID=2851013 RepID=A0ABS6V648_9SPHN|nr:fasciclin domain-containing protein [Sphingomicrobium sp. B8]